MKIKLLLLAFLGLFYLSAEAPEYTRMFSTEREVVYPFNVDDPILRAFIKYESNFDPFAENRVTKARGILQILPPMIKEVNRILKEYGLDIRFTWKDAWNPEKSIHIWYIVQTYHNPDYNLIKAVKIWFGRGKQYDGMRWPTYHHNVQKYLS